MAAAHILVMEDAEGEGGRFPCCSNTLMWRDVCALMAEAIAGNGGDPALVANTAGKKKKG